jgi:CRP/FNR family transcriptional regulator
MFFAAELKESEKRMRNLAHTNTRGRIAQALLSLQQKFGVDAAGCIDIDISRQDLASYTGTTYEKLFKMLNELADENILAVSKKKIAITDQKKLTLVISDN